MVWQDYLGHLDSDLDLDPGSQTLTTYISVEEKTNVMWRHEPMGVKFLGLNEEVE